MPLIYNASVVRGTVVRKKVIIPANPGLKLPKDFVSLV